MGAEAAKVAWVGQAGRDLAKAALSRPHSKTCRQIGRAP